MSDARHCGCCGRALTDLTGWATAAQSYCFEPECSEAFFAEARAMIETADPQVAARLRQLTEAPREPAHGCLYVGYTESGEVVINHPDLQPDAHGVGHIIFSPTQARHLADNLLKQANLAEMVQR